MNRIYALVGAAVAIIGIVVWVMLRIGGGTTPAARHGTESPAGSAVVVTTDPSLAAPPPSLPSGDPATPGSDVPANERDYMVGDIRVRDHRTGHHQPLDLPPNIHPDHARELPSTLTHDISQKVNKVLFACAADLPKEARGDKPRLEGQVTVAIKDHTLSVTSTVAQVRDVHDDHAVDALKQCVEQKSVGLTSAADDQADIDGYGIAITFAIP